jgi:two-component system NarL family response regulator
MRVLLVDDHPLFLEGLGSLLAAHDIDVVGTAGDGLEALHQARVLRPDVILMDIEMPRCDGLSATRLIKAEMPEVKIVMLTVSAEDEHLFEAIKSGAAGYLLKSLDAPRFFDLLSGLEQDEAPLSPGLAAKLLQEFSRLGAMSDGGARPDGEAKGETTRSQPTSLTPRQVAVLVLVAQGMTYRNVGEALCISERTVKYHMAEILDRLHLENRAAVIAYAARVGLVRGGENQS